MLASSYPLLDVFLSLLYFFLFFLWIYILILIFTDIFRSHDLGGGGKAAWFIFVLILPFLGAFIYLIARGGKMHEHAEQAAAEQQKAFQDYVQQTAGVGSTADQLSKLSELKDKGTITQAEFDAQKAKLLG